MAKKRKERRENDGLSSTQEEAKGSASDSQELKEAQHTEGGSARMSLLILFSIFTCAASVMYLVYRNFPELPDLQTFAIPGSIFLSILSGYLYPFPLALFLVCLCSGLGASFCYMLSYLVGRPIVYKYLTERAQKWSNQVEQHRDHLINYIIFLRITPFLPNWFINITSPVINVPLGVFFIGTFLGVAPPSFVAINAGTTLYKLTTAGEAVSWNSLAVLGVLAVLSILPVCFQKKLQKKLA
ncbi:transmembrane protein 41B isoform X2 [Pungitius pungitius]|uniref:transmembrane protein 41B isoform X2 n=1 Tax=Pungitius pungitius TaxID=134920 RepID=UPI00188887E5|nr:transmembrane protein 41B isoform X2 [Pungitius pungitius]